MVRITTYKDLEKWINRWVSGDLDLVMLESSPGLGKSHTVAELLKGVKHLAISNHSTPLATFKQLHDNQNNLTWFDDVGQLLCNKISLNLLMALCETKAVKTLSWNTTSEAIGETPQQFQTTSKVLITCNKIQGNNPFMQAIKDRAFVLTFEPTAEELVSKFQEVSNNYPFLADAEKEQVLAIVEQNAKLCKNLSLRSLIKGFQLVQHHKRTGIAWGEDFLQLLGLSDKLVKMNKLLLLYQDDKERLESDIWKGYSRSSFYRTKAILQNG